MQTTCRTCRNKGDCWVEEVINFRQPMPSKANEQQICVNASNYECDLYESSEGF